MFGFYARDEFSVFAPAKGKIMDISEVNDPVYSQKVMGDGIAIELEEDQIFAPFDGTVRMVSENRHAVAISKMDVEVLIHAGLDTAGLKGAYFTAHVKKGDFVKKGTLLLTVDRNGLKKAGKSLTTPVVIMSTPEKIIDIKKYTHDPEGKIMDLKIRE